MRNHGRKKEGGKDTRCKENEVQREETNKHNDREMGRKIGEKIGTEGTEREITKARDKGEGGMSQWIGEWKRGRMKIMEVRNN